MPCFDSSSALLASISMLEEEEFKMDRNSTIWKRRRTRGFTLMELIVVVLIIGILATLTTPLFFKTRLKGLTKVAVSILQSIRAAERAYRSALPHYFPASGAITDVAAINSNLSTDFVDDGYWDYSITNPGGSFTASATLKSRWWNNPPTLTIDAANENVSCTAGDCAAAGF